jgi:hypothetical protein
MECMRMRHGVDATLERLTYLSGELGNCRDANGPGDKQDRWLRWWSQADTQVRNLFSDGEMAASLYVSSERVRNVNMAALPNGVLTGKSMPGLSGSRRRSGSWRRSSRSSSGPGR